MFTSRHIIFALLSFLASANACIQCPASLRVNNHDTDLIKTTPGDKTVCLYGGAESDGSAITCRYSNIGLLIHGNKACPLEVDEKEHC
ncbi:uncharacterized protein EDB91DRAFT_1157772 [Suillus paluster]|uniref:uncharacterized protein n=1 Tax=Suillus paluster TaxID=48578 RepID=UPI001B88522A|nr:uncharacterized protein EDB91DRAFT_1157772 [Suillus paluster]KAG1730100.1 hypothetical protein EDB91DRAFT_1157772 [Suillus paluster]